MSENSERSVTLPNGGLNKDRLKRSEEIINSLKGGVRRTRLGEESAQKTNPRYAPLIKSKKGI